MIKNKLNIHNNYKVRVVNKDGEVIQEGYAENTVLNQFWNRINVSSTGYGGTNFNVLAIGIGAPTTGNEVDPDRTALYSKLGNSVALRERSVSSELDGSTRVTKLTANAIIPATSEYVGEVTEVGLGFASYPPSPHITLSSLALFKDSEGNPISISKTTSDSLIIDITVYIVLNYADDILPIATIDEISRRIAETREGAFYNSIPIALTCLGENSSLSSADLGYISNHIGSSYSLVDKVNRTLPYQVDRTLDTQQNRGFANYININGIGNIKLPNLNHFPHYIISDLEVDTGDGVKKEFIYPIPEFNINTDVVKVDGVPLVRGVDYTLANDNNSKGYSSSFASHKNIFTTKVNSGSSIIKYSTYHPASSEILTYEEPITVEGFKLSFTSGNVKIDYSTDGDTWVNILDKSNPTYGEWINLDAPITSKYWRIEASGRLYGLVDTASPIAFGKKPTHLVFTNPPALGAKITTTCEVDRPFKSEEFIFDTSFTMSY